MLREDGPIDLQLRDHVPDLFDPVFVGGTFKKPQGMALGLEAEKDPVSARLDLNLRVLLDCGSNG